MHGNATMIPVPQYRQPGKLILGWTILQNVWYHYSKTSSNGHKREEWTTLTTHPVQWGQPRLFRSSPSAEVIPHHWSPPSYWQSASIERPPPTLLGWTLRHHNQYIEEELLFFYVCKLANFFQALLRFEAYYCNLVKLCPEQTGVSRGSVNNGSMCR